MIRTTGGPAFPIMDSQTVHRIGAAACEGLTDPAERDKAYLAATVDAASGMTLRDYFAGQALEGVVRKMHFAQNIAETAYEIADAMLAERAK